MAFTEANLAAVEDAIITVSAGGVAEIADGLGNKTRFQDLAALLKLKEVIEKDIFKSARTSGFDKMKFATKQSLT